MARQHRSNSGGRRTIMGGDENALIRLWQEKRGEAAPAELSGELIVQLGLATEELNRSWYERHSGHRVGQRQSRKFHPSVVWRPRRWMGVEQTGAVFESKFMLPWSFSEQAAAEKHMARRCSTTMVVGSIRPRAVIIDRRRHGFGLLARGEQRAACRPTKPSRVMNLITSHPAFLEMTSWKRC